MKPPSRSSARLCGLTLSGLASVVTSAPVGEAEPLPDGVEDATRSALGSSVGVPPPKNTVSTAGAPGSTSASRSSSRLAVAAKLAWEAPPPSSAAV